MASEPIWLTFADAIQIHDDQLRLFQGAAGIRDENLVHSALSAPQNLFHYEQEDDVLTLAVKLCVALAKNHGFIDGNKRTATAAMIEFLALNGYDLRVPDDRAQPPPLGRWIEQTIEGSLSAEQLRTRLEPFLR